METYTKTAIAKLLVQTGYLDEFIEGGLQILRDGVLETTDDMLIAKRQEYRGAQAFANMLRFTVAELVRNNDPEQRLRDIVP